jgi:hypothetical protein
MKHGTKTLRSLVAGGSLIALVTALAPIAQANDSQGKKNHDAQSQVTATPSPKPTILFGTTPTLPNGVRPTIQGLPPLGDDFVGKVNGLEDAGDALEGKAHALETQQSHGKKHPSSPAIDAALAVWKTAHDSAIATFKTTTQVAQDAYKAAIAA